jgi:predicted DNA-binding protein (MmcQ/YjbR family)
MTASHDPAFAPAIEALRQIALAYPEANEEFPWGHSAFKVRGKSFAFVGGAEGRMSLSVKLPQTKDMALMLPFTKPTGYGLGKSGWVSADFPAGDDVPLALLQDWLDESYRAIAPKKLVATLPPKA